ncbi:MAG: tetratricopeptide repeat protein [Deltaproteobacteria bacterium]|nr:tetratricopeptide repeat protein [Deltaproteobacteria bacterium]
MLPGVVSTPVGLVCPFHEAAPSVHGPICRPAYRAGRGVGGCASKNGKPKVSEDDKKQATAHFEMAMAYMQNDRGSEALDELETAIRLNPLDPEIHNALGLV